MTTDDLYDAPEPEADDAPAAEPIEALGPSYEPTDDAAEPVGPASPFYDREWRGAPLYMCPAGDFPGRSHRAVVRHIVASHRPADEPDIDTRARQAGIILAHR